MFSSAIPPSIPSAFKFMQAPPPQRAAQAMPEAPSALKPLQRDTVRFGHYKDDLACVATRNEKIQNSEHATEEQKNNSKDLTEWMNDTAQTIRTNHKTQLSVGMGMLSTGAAGPVGGVIGAGLGYIFGKMDSKNPKVQNAFRANLVDFEELDIFKRGKAHFIDLMALGCLPAGTYHYFDRFGDYKEVTLEKKELKKLKNLMKKLDLDKVDGYLRTKYYYSDSTKDPEYEKDPTFFQPLFFPIASR